MDIKPSYVAVGKLFKEKAIYEVPKYQRAYAWEEESIEDFLKDTKKAYNARKVDNPIKHFFGGILCVQNEIEGTMGDHKRGLIDGQQRITTTTLLAASLIKIYGELLDSLDGRPKEIVKERIKKLQERFIQFSQEIHMTETVVDVLTLSKADNSFYREMIDNLSPQTERESHKRLKNAHVKIYNEINKLIKDDDIQVMANNVQILEYVIDNDFTILYMKTTTKKDAYRLFQVINDRGIGLTEGDLLRAKTLELLERYPSQQDAVERIWDEILKEDPKTTLDYLTWIYESYTGKRPKPSALYDKFVEHFFSVIPSSKENAMEIFEQAKKLKEDIAICRKLTSEEWVFEHRQPINEWDRDKLTLLLGALNHTLAYPLLIAAKKLDHVEFAKIVHILEKVFFRYKIICNGHATPLKKIYQDEAIEIRRSPSRYNINSLRTKLNKLLDAKADDMTFSFNLKALEYDPDNSTNNRKIRYFLLNIEYYYKCYSNGLEKSEDCIDKSRVYPFSDTSIEHIYPRNANGDKVEEALEPLKNKLGNLCLMDPAQNTIAGDKTFEEKKETYKKTTVNMLREIGEKESWTEEDISQSADNMVTMALKIFRA